MSGKRRAVSVDPGAPGGDGPDPCQAVSTETLAAVLGLTPRHIQRLAAAGALPRVERGKYPLGPAVQAYLRTLEGRHHQVAADQEDTQRFRRARAEQTELAIAKARNDAVPALEAYHALRTVIEAATRQACKVPVAMARRLTGIDDAAVMQRSLEHELRPGREAAAEALQQLADEWTRDRGG